MRRLDKVFDIYLILFFVLVIGITTAFLFEKQVNILYIIPAIIWFFAIYWISVYGTLKHFGFYLFLFVLITKVITVVVIDTPPISDFKMMIEAAKAFAIGDYSFKDNGYFTAWAYQSGFVVYEGLVVKLFGYHLILMKLINCLWIALTTALVYSITKRLLNDVAARAAGLIHATYIPLFLYAPVLTNQHIATFFYYLGFYFIVKEESETYKKWIYAGIALALGNVMRPMGIIWLTAIGIWAVFELFSSRKTYHHLESLKRFGTCLIIYLVVFYGISQILVSVGVTDTGLKNNNPYWKFVVGLNEDTKGLYSFEDVKMLKDKPIDQRLIDKEKELIRERLSIPPYRLAKLMINKVGSMWGNYELGVFTFPHMLGKDIKRFGKDFDKLYTRMLNLEKMVYMIIIGLVLYGLFIQFFSNYKSKYKIIYYVLTLYTGIHFLIEVSPRYKYVMMGIIFMLAGNGIRYISNRTSG